MIKRKKLYCAGKIRHGDWRSLLVPEIAIAGACFDAGFDDFNEWPIVSFGNQYEYVGPYFVSGEHVCAHGDNTHGAGLTDDIREYDPDRASLVVDLCQQAIEICDVFFAWIDDVTAFGTIAEIGYAAAFNKTIYIAGPKRFDDLWFVYKLATKSMFSDIYSDRNLPTLIEEMHLDLKSMRYANYLQTSHWQMVRDVIRERAGNRCELCYSDKNLNIHHKTYDRRGYELRNDLICLCGHCHAKFHDKLPKESV